MYKLKFSLFQYTNLYISYKDTKFHQIPLRNNWDMSILSYNYRLIYKIKFFLFQYTNLYISYNDTKSDPIEKQLGYANF